MAKDKKIEFEFELEEEEKDNFEFSSNDITQPFDPAEINIVVSPGTVDSLVSRIRHGEIDMNTEFQRKGNLWKPDAQSRLIESLMLRFPLPAFYFDTSDDNNWLIVDGLQRLWTLKNFIVDKSLILKGLEIYTEFNDQDITFDKLPRTFQRRILESQVTTFLIHPGTPKKARYHIFRRINTGGLSLNPMEIRHALNQGRPANFLQELAEKSRFPTILPLDKKRMEDRELLLRAIAFILRTPDSYFTPMSSFLDSVMESLDETKNVALLPELAENTLQGIEFQFQLFGDEAFTKSILKQEGSRAMLNSALFEVWVSISAKLNQQEKSNLLSYKKALKSDYLELLQEPTFYKSISVSTASKKAVSRRFEGIQELVDKYK